MAKKSETPRKRGASRNSCAGCFRESNTPHVTQTQLLVGAHHVRPSLAPLIAELAFGIGGYHD